MTPELASAVETAYRIFARHPRGQVDEAPRDVAPEAQAALNASPLRAIAPFALFDYARFDGGYRLDAETMAQYRAFLPRILEILANSSTIPHALQGDEDVLLTYMRLAEWRAHWPADEVAALDGYFAALFDDCLGAPLEIRRLRAVPSLHGRDLSWFLWVVGNAGGDAAIRVLPRAAAREGRAVDLRIAGLARDIARDAVDAAEGAPLDAMLAVLETDETLGAQCPCARCAQKKAAWEWLAASGLRRRMEAAFLAEADPDAAALFSLAEALIAALIETRARRA